MTALLYTADMAVHVSVPKALVLLLAGGLANAQTVDPAAQQEQNRVEGQVEKKYTIQLDATPHKQYCQGQVATSYLQKNTLANVKVSVSNPDCGPSSGEFTLAVRFKDENGDMQTVETVETWQRHDDTNIELEREYYMGENVDLIRVRARKIVCICNDPEDTEESLKGENE